MSQKLPLWKNEPVIQPTEHVGVDGPIDLPSDESPVNNTSFPLIKGFEWDTLSLNNPKHTNQLVQFLNLHYVKDANTLFKQKYTDDYIKWMYSAWDHIILAVRMQSNNVLVGTIAGRVIKMQINNKQMNMVEVDLLCVHPKLRGKNMIHVMIKELRRQFASKGLYYGFFTSKTSKSTIKPVATTKSYSRPLNISKLLDTKYVRLEGKIKVENLEKHYELTQKKLNLTINKMTEEDIECAYSSLTEYLEKFNVHPIWTLEQFRHVFFANPFVESYVVLKKDEDNGGTNYVAEFISYSKNIMVTNKAHQIVKAHLFYYTCHNETLYNLVKNLLVILKENKIDILDLTDIMENEEAIDRLQFDENPSTYCYYLYNWRIAPLLNIQVGLCHC